jgi:hypothetical protein
LHHYLRPIPLDLSLFPYHIHTYHFSEKKKLPHPPRFGSLIIMAHTRSQYLEAHLNTLQSNFTETQQEVKKISANVVAINTTMSSSIVASIKELKQDMTTHLQSLILMICTKLHIPADNPLSNPPPHTKVETSSHSHNSHPHHFQRGLCLPWVDVTKFDGSDPTNWVTQMEHYFSLYRIIYYLAKL